PPGNLIENHPSLLLHEGWRLARTPAGACPSPDALAASNAQWLDARVPGTVASSIHREPAARGDYDADDWWYRLELKLPAIDPARRYRLRFDGLATLADVWLNGAHILEARNMFRAYRVDVTAGLRDENEIVIRFASLARSLAAKRPRPKWKTALVTQQNLRWFRTTLAGRIPGWTPPIQPVGPWAPIALEIIDGLDITSFALHATAKGSDGRLVVDMRAVPPPGAQIDEARVRVGDRVFALAVQSANIHGDITIPEIALWWPHTHGTPALHACRIDLRVSGEWTKIDCGKVGFRSIEMRGCDPSACDGPIAFAAD